MERLIPGITNFEARLLKYLTENVIDQDKTMEDVAAAIALINSRINFGSMNAPNRPIYTALLLGPSGVGKTFTPEILARFFGLKGIIKINCAEYRNEAGINNLIGASKGYHGYFDPNMKDPRFNYTPPLFYDIYRFEESRSGAVHGRAGQDSKKIIELQNTITGLDIAREKYIKYLEEMMLSPNGATEKELKALAQYIIMFTSKREKLAKELEEAAKEKSPEGINDADWFDFEEGAHSTDATGGDFQRKVRAIVLFDEFEKASDALHDLALSILEKGEAQLSYGETVSFKDAIVMMTSNIGSRGIVDIQTGKHKIGFISQGQKNIYRFAREEAEIFFKPELLNRIDWIGVFRPLSKNSLAKIFDIKLKELQYCISEHSEINLTVSEEAKNFIVNEVDRAQEGARLLERKIEHHLKRPLMRLEAAKKISRGDQIEIRFENEKIVFLKAEKEEEAEEAGVSID